MKQENKVTVYRIMVRPEPEESIQTVQRHRSESFFWELVHRDGWIHRWPVEQQLNFSGVDTEAILAVQHSNAFTMGKETSLGDHPPFPLSFSHYLYRPLPPTTLTSDISRDAWRWSRRQVSFVGQQK